MFVNASRKSDRSFIGAFLPDLFSVTYQFFRCLSNTSGNGQLEGVIFLNEFVHLWTDSRVFCS